MGIALLMDEMALDFIELSMLRRWCCFSMMLMLMFLRSIMFNCYFSKSMFAFRRLFELSESIRKYVSGEFTPTSICLYEFSLPSFRRSPLSVWIETVF
jgi:hypothetical protein